VPHPLELEYGLTAAELLDAVSKRFRLKVALEGAVAEVHLRRKIEDLQARGVIARYEEHDINGYPDFTIWPAGSSKSLLVECKNVRDDDYTRGGTVVAYRVEVQKTRAAKADPSTRYYGAGYFDILAVCLGKKTGNWSEFMLVKTEYLERHPGYPDKLAVMHRVPLPESTDIAPWYLTLERLLGAL
jgi:hypothetical protein